MHIFSLQQFVSAMKSLIFELSLNGFPESADRLNRVAFEDNSPDSTDHLLELATELRDVQALVPFKIRELAERLELFARNYRRVTPTVN
jgi:hypothetical protein